jgi:copper chaperone CopZ
MSRAILLLLLALSLLTPVVGTAATHSADSVTLTVRGMFCGSCANTVRKALAPLPGIIAVAVDVKTDRVTVTYNRQKASVPQMVAAIRKAGYEAEAPRSR